MSARKYQHSTKSATDLATLLEIIVNTKCLTSLYLGFKVVEKIWLRAGMVRYVMTNIGRCWQYLAWIELAYSYLRCTFLDHHLQRNRIVSSVVRSGLRDVIKCICANTALIIVVRLESMYPDSWNQNNLVECEKRKCMLACMWRPVAILWPYMRRLRRMNINPPDNRYFWEIKKVKSLKKVLKSLYEQW